MKFGTELEAIITRIELSDIQEYVTDEGIAKAKAAIIELVKTEVIGEYSKYPSHYTISDVLHEQRNTLDEGAES